MDESKILVKKKKKGFVEPFDREKIHKAIRKSAERIIQALSDEDCNKVSDRVVSLIKEEEIGVRKLHNIVEVALDDVGFNRVAESYRQYRNYKEDAQAIMDAVDRKTLELSYKEDKSNANTDSLLVSTKRSILYGEQQKEKYKRIFLNPEERKANDEGYIYINDLKDRLSTFNCFSRDTRFVTNLGVKSFGELYDGQKIQVLDKNGEWKEATVGYFGKQVMYDVEFTSGRSSKTVVCTRDHRWILKDGTVTTNLKVGDKICETVDITSKFDPYSASIEDLRTWCFGFIIGDGADSTCQKNGVYARLCSNKTKYLDLFIKAGYVKSSYNYENKDIAVRCKNTPSKQNFLNGSAWKYLPLHSKVALFNGYYAADGGSRANRICTSDKRVCRMIEDISSCSGYYIASKTVINHNTNYKTDATLYMYNLRKRTGVTNNWIVKKINYHLNKKKEMDAWCVIEPTTHSFTLEGGLVTGNCDLCNLGRILKDGFVLANIKYTEPKSLNAAMSVSTDIISAYAGQQYGGTTIPEIDTVFAPYAKKSYDFYIDQYKEIVKKANGVYDPKLADEYAEERVKREAEQQYQHMEHSMNSIASSRGDYAFITFTFGHSTDRWAKMISNVFLDVRRGGQGEGAGKVPVLFPKLVFLYDSELHGEGKPLEDLFENAVETAKQCMYPDFLSLDAGYVGDVYNKWGKIISPMGCRAFLSPVFKKSEWTEPQDETDELLIYRCNLGVVSINLPMIYQKSKVEGKQFYDVLDYYLEIARNIGKKTKNYLAKFKASCNPLCFTQGGFDGGDLDPEDTIESVLKYSTISFGYGGLHELSKLAIGKSLSEDPSFALDTMKHMNEVINRFKEEDHLLWAIYGTPGESWLPIACEQFIKTYGKIKGVTDKGFFTNSFHICVDEDITPIEKIEKEAKFFPLSKGGCINHVRIPSIAPEMNEGIKSIIRYAMSLGLYHSINHAQNRCTDCGHHWIGDDSLSFEENFTCPKCGSLRTIGIRRMNGYLGYNKTWSGKTKFNEGKEKEFSIRKNL